MSPTGSPPDLARMRATVLYNAGIGLHGQGRLEDAVTAFRDAVEADPRFAEAHFNLGNALARCGRWDEAVEAYRAAAGLVPAAAEPPFALGVAYEQLGHARAAAGRRVEAAAAYRAALLFRPEAPAAHFALAKVLLELGRPAEAVVGFARAARLDPASADAFGGLGSALRRLERHADAAAACAVAIRLQPMGAVAHATLGDALHGLERLEEAVGAYRRAVALSPGFLQAYVQLGSALLALGLAEESLAACRAAATLDPAPSAPHNNLGNALKALGRVDEAEQAFAAAVARAPEDPLIRLNHALALLTLARFEAGWEAYEARWRTGMVRPRHFTQPQWDGEPLEGRTILLHAEQGMGDTLHFVRYAPLVAARGGRVILEVQKPLLRLMQGVGGVERVVAQGDPLPDFDLHAPLLGLPRAFATRLDGIPGAVPYLRADPAAVGSWRARLPADGLRVGLVWAGEARKGVPHANRIDRQRSLALAQLAPLAGIPGVRFVSLQKGPPAEQLRDPPPGLDVLDLMDGVADFADTAALVETLDLVVGVDTSVIHLAGALAKPVWVLSRFDGCWRWLLGRDDSPWYPTLRLYRQDRPLDWTGAVARLAADLRAYATAHESGVGWV
ncbi:MAG TPA: tetratricopeptide repeat-containing glycosyltransferase family protein [Azospirillum sp.]|nr:tetratricopeptide repeat-containing glycosyltransferase family protein [Azospirillum sp.]